MPGVAGLMEKQVDQEVLAAEVVVVEGEAKAAEAAFANPQKMAIKVFPLYLADFFVPLYLPQ